MKTIYKILTLFLLISLYGCGKEIGDNSEVNTSMKQEGRRAEYRVDFVPLTSSFMSQPTGSVTIFYDETMTLNNKLKITMEMENLPAGVRHPQYIHEGTSCPTMDHDQNRDGYVDYEEALHVYGANIMGLDATPYDEERDWDSVFPRGAKYFYWREMDVTKVPVKPEINGKVIVIYGAAKDSLPETVAAKPGNTKEGFFPIACGVITSQP